jgi:HSP20 family molecular chaperone IbpA
LILKVFNFIIKQISMALINFFPHRCGTKYWDVWDWPQILFNQDFGLDFDDTYGSRRQQLTQRSGTSEVTNDENKFVVKLDCKHFKPEEITVKTIGNNVVINGKHEEKMDKHGWVQREFTRRYALPEGCQPEKVESSLSSDGLLMIEAHKQPIEKTEQTEREVPIAITNESKT